MKQDSLTRFEKYINNIDSYRDGKCIMLPTLPLIKIKADVFNGLEIWIHLGDKQKISH